ncbi:conserved hypothetical protein [Microsporum canis CBS 113480]|uniref:Uncharacterized protein n=1 Tax=Arthroderma otae (strain ATCC MYA-4605 / CBS 113480) TaxID=554155 RepID=C5FJS6_ARTOC|nr:conserved hypothetical protein [Microsporum canis CBS 113480]EEQ30937.1 conserved hypothetical protein [Microsporum canis CBS 113480]
MSDAGLQSRADPFGDTLETLWQRSKKKLPFLKNDSKEPPDRFVFERGLVRGELWHLAVSGMYILAIYFPSEMSKSPKMRRSSGGIRVFSPCYCSFVISGLCAKVVLQIQLSLTRAPLRPKQRTKDGGIKSGEPSGGLLREIMIAHGIPLPQTKPRDRLATVTVVGEPGFGQRLQVSLDEGPDKIPPVYPEGFGVTLTQKVLHKAAEFFISSPTTNQIGADEPRPEDFNSELQIRPKNGSGVQGYYQQQVIQPHPYHFDSTQVAVDFVLL